MNEDNIKLAVLVTASAAIVGLSIREYLKVHRTETAKRAEIERNKKLDIAAIRAAGARASKKLEEDGLDMRDLAQIMSDLRTDIEFQKIAIREQ